MIEKLSNHIIKATNDPLSEFNYDKLRQLQKEGVITQLCKGRYANRNIHTDLEEQEKYALKVLAHYSTSSNLVVSHRTAAFFHGFFVPTKKLTQQIQFRLNPQISLERKSIKTFRYKGVFETEEINGVRITTIPQTLFDCARELPPSEVICYFDEALRLKKTNKIELLIFKTKHYPKRHGKKISRLIDFATQKSDSYGESLTRWNLNVIGAPKPELQYPISVGEEQFYVDFAFPEHGVFLEFDGWVKYRGNYGSGEYALEQEKRREDLIRKHTGYKFIRITWDIARNPVHLANTLRSDLPINFNPWKNHANFV